MDENEIREALNRHWAASDAWKIPTAVGRAGSPRRAVRVKDDAPVEFGDAVPASERERAVDLAAEELEHPSDPP